MEMGQKKIFIVENENIVKKRLQDNHVLELCKRQSISVIYLTDKDDTVNIDTIKGEQVQYAILLHANSEDINYREAFTNRVKLYKSVFSMVYILSGDPIIKKEFRTEPNIDYTQLFSMIEDERIWIIKSQKKITIDNQENYDYLFITALYKAEFEYLKLFCDFHDKDKVKEKENTHYIGTLKFDNTKKVVAIHQLETGMIDAAILTAEMIARYKPNTVVMTGVCGGNPNSKDLHIGDIIIPKHIFMFDKGKKIVKDGENILLNELNHVHIAGGLITQIRDNEELILKNLKSHFVNEILPRAFNPSNLKIHTDKSMACSIAVINADGFFKEFILSKERNTIGVEMESYSVARACELSDSKPNCLIIKSVMDKTRFKTDAGKRLAGQTSAKFLEEILRMKII